jgi:hypothetical protein
MNENDLTNVPPPIAPDSAAVPPLPAGRPIPLTCWLQKFFVCNPFYLVSAALLLFGCYRVSVDAPLLNLESARLVFNFTSVQVYELLLVLTAIFLARRQLWYDSTLLVGLENLLVFVPFILISHAALTDTQMTQMMCAVGVLAAFTRFGGLKKYFPELNFPIGLLVAGGAFLAANVALPLAYRHFAETKFGIHMDYGPAYVMNECAWLLILPAVTATAMLLPRTHRGGNLLPQHNWLPAGIFSLWLVVTGGHLYALNYVYDYYLRSDLFAPLAWVIAWTLFLRVPAKSLRLTYALTVPAILTPLLAATPVGAKYFLALGALNLVAYGTVGLVDRSNRLARHLCFVALLMLIAGLPVNWMHFVATGFTHLDLVAAGLAAYVIFWTAWLRNPKLAIFGAITFGIIIASVFNHHAGVGYWAFQGGLVFLLLHSLRWHGGENHEAEALRTLTAVVWAVQSFIWVNSERSSFWMPFVPGLVVLGACVIYRLRHGLWGSPAVPVAAMLVIMSGPTSAAVDGIRTAPVGLLAVIGSFLLLGIGTMTALTRHLWHKHEQVEAKPSTRGSAGE